MAEVDGTAARVVSFETRRDTNATHPERSRRYRARQKAKREAAEVAAGIVRLDGSHGLTAAGQRSLDKLARPGMSRVPGAGRGEVRPRCSTPTPSPGA